MSRTFGEGETSKGEAVSFTWVVDGYKVYELGV